MTYRQTKQAANVTNKHLSHTFNKESQTLLSIITKVCYWYTCNENETKRKIIIPYLLNDRVCIGFVWDTSSATRCPWARFHTRILQSAPADAKYRPQTLNASECIGDLWPVIRRTWLPVVQSHRHTRLSLDPVAM